MAFKIFHMASKIFPHAHYCPGTSHKTFFTPSETFYMSSEKMCMPNETFAGQSDKVSHPLMQLWAREKSAWASKIFQSGPAKIPQGNRTRFSLSWAIFFNILKHSWLVANTWTSATTSNFTGQQPKSTGPLWYHSRRMMKLCHFFPLLPLWHHKIASVRKGHQE